MIDKLKTMVIFIGLTAMSITACQQQEKIKEKTEEVINEAKDLVQEMKPGMQGTYKLISRKLPDGTMLNPPMINGLLTYTKDHRNFNIMWQDSKGKVLSISYIARYDLTDSTYSESSIYYMINDQINNKGIKYDFTGPIGSSPIMKTSDRLEFKLPLYLEPKIIFENGKMTAESPEFVDVWEKIQ